MKKIFIYCLPLILFVFFFAPQSLFSQEYLSDTIVITGYIEDYNYVLNPNESNIDSVSYVASNGEIVYVPCDRAYSLKKYRKMTPGELIVESGKLRNKAIVVGIATTVAATSIGLLPLNPHLTEHYLATTCVAGVIGLSGFVAVLVLTVNSNNLLKEAGTRLNKITITGNGVTIKF